MSHRIFVVDDHPVMVDAYMTVLGYEQDFETCGAATSGEEAIQMLTDIDCDLVLADYRMPGLNGAELVRQLRALRPDLKAIVVSAHEDAAFAREAMEAGAAAFLKKRDLMDMLVPTIRAVLAGQV
ncbi:MAG TPA: response regulator transcription factor [Rubricoccaceae bacterium]|jgi:DNA-binding NarL/FixJ family response regulator